MNMEASEISKIAKNIFKESDYSNLDCIGKTDKDSLSLI
jgi:lipopolysaccharide assembly outer membrane protein LptD (OstA)